MGESLPVSYLKKTAGMRVNGILMALAKVAAGVPSTEGILTESADGHMFSPVQKERERRPSPG